MMTTGGQMLNLDVVAASSSTGATAASNLNKNANQTEMKPIISDETIGQQSSLPNNNKFFLLSKRHFVSQNSNLQQNKHLTGSSSIGIDNQNDNPSTKMSYSSSTSSSFTKYSSPMCSSSSSIMLMALLASCLYMILFGAGSNVGPITMAYGQPMEFHKTFDHRSAMNTLKELDKHYSQVARPRFGKRNPLMIMEPMMSAPENFVMDNGIGNEDLAPISSSQAGGNIGAIFDNGPYRWLLINRQQPLTKLTENYLLEILADSLERRQQQNNGNGINQVDNKRFQTLKEQVLKNH